MDQEPPYVEALGDSFLDRRDNSIDYPNSRIGDIEQFNTNSTVNSSFFQDNFLITSGQNDDSHNVFDQ